MCHHRAISVFIVPYRPNKANRNYVLRKNTCFVEHIFFLCKKSPDFHKWPYETFFIIL